MQQCERRFQQYKRHIFFKVCLCCSKNHASAYPHFLAMRHVELSLGEDIVPLHFQSTPHRYWDIMSWAAWNQPSHTQTTYNLIFCCWGWPCFLRPHSICSTFQRLGLTFLTSLNLQWQCYVQGCALFFWDLSGVLQTCLAEMLGSRACVSWVELRVYESHYADTTEGPIYIGTMHWIFLTTSSYEDIGKCVAHICNKWPSAADPEGAMTSSRLKKMRKQKAPLHLHVEASFFSRCDIEEQMPAQNLKLPFAILQHHIIVLILFGNRAGPDSRIGSGCCRSSKQRRGLACWGYM